MDNHVTRKLTIHASRDLFSHIVSKSIHSAKVFELHDFVYTKLPKHIDQDKQADHAITVITYEAI